MALVPSTVRGLVDSVVGRTGLQLRVVCSGGEILPPELAQRFAETTSAQLYNVYGPTETAIFATAWPCRKLTLESSLPVGRPISESRIYILDQAGKILPFGVSGEVFIGGRAIARGYLNRPDLTLTLFAMTHSGPGSACTAPATVAG